MSEPKRTGHNHFTRRVLEYGECPACDMTHVRSAVARLEDDVIERFSWHLDIFIGEGMASALNIVVDFARKNS